jgi:uncharacterized protein YpmS
MIKFVGFLNVFDIEVPMITTRKIQIYLMISVLVLASLACNYAKRNANRLLDPPQTTSSSDGLGEVPLNAQGKLRLVVSEAQLTDLISKELSSQPDPVLQDPQVYLRDGQMVLTGKVQQSGLNAELEMIMEVGVTADGRPDISLVSVSVGMFSLPQNMLDDLSSQIKSAFESKIDHGIDQIFIESITIDGGEMVIEGHAR